MSDENKALALARLEELSERIPEFASQISPLYAVLDWHWQEYDHTPSRSEVAAAISSKVARVREMLREAKVEDTSVSVSSGGITVSVEDLDGDPTAVLAFTHDITFGDGWEA